MNTDTTEGLTEKQLRDLKQKDRYLLEKGRIIEQIGDLEDIRATLGLSQRKLCQLLLVDPSAWTRWLKSGAPPLIYQALRWLIELRSHNPDAMLSQSLDHRIDLVQARASSEIQSLQNQVAILNAKLIMMIEMNQKAEPVSKPLRRKRKVKKKTVRKKKKAKKKTKKKVVRKKKKKSFKKKVARKKKKASKKAYVKKRNKKTAVKRKQKATRKVKKKPGTKRRVKR